MTTIKELRIRKGHKLIFINSTKISYCKADGCYSFVHLNDGTFYCITKPLKEVEKLLDNEIFHRCHNSYLVNILEIRSINISQRRINQNLCQIPISTRKFESFLYNCKRHNIKCDFTF